MRALAPSLPGVRDERAINFHPVTVSQRSSGRHHPAEYPQLGPLEVDFRMALQDARSFNRHSCGSPLFDLEREQNLPVGQRVDDLDP